MGDRPYRKQTPVPGYLVHPWQGSVRIPRPCCGWKADSALQHLLGEPGVSELQKRNEIGRGISSLIDPVLAGGLRLQTYSNKLRCKGLHMYVFHYPNTAQSQPATVSCLLSLFWEVSSDFCEEATDEEVILPSGHGGCMN